MSKPWVGGPDFCTRTVGQCDLRVMRIGEAYWQADVRQMGGENWTCWKTSKRAAQRAAMDLARQLNATTKGVK